MQEVVIILGASALQVPLINFVKQKGYFVIVVSIPGNYPGFSLADKAVFLDVRDVNGIYAAVKDYHIVSVLTDETDIAVPTVAALAKKLHVEGNDPRTASIYANKFLMREACRQTGVPVPKYTLISNTEDITKKMNSIKFPAIMKPEDNQGSRGVFKVSSHKDILRNFQESQSYSTTGNVIVEEFFKGKEVVCEGFVLDGEYLNWGFADRTYFDAEDIFIPSQTIFPSYIPIHIKDKIIESEQRLHNKLRPHFGMIHSEYLYDDTSGEYVLVETSLRGGGVYISSHLIPLYTSYNNYELLFSCSLGKMPSINDISSQISHNAAGYLCFSLPEGEVVSLAGISEIKAMPGVIHADVDDIKVGMKTSKMKDKTMRMGPIIISTDDRATLEAIIRDIRNTLSITVRCNDGSLKGVIWD